MNPIKNKDDYKTRKGRREGGLLVFGIGVVGDTFKKCMVHLQKHSIVLEGWVSNKLGKGGNEGSFVVWCWRDFEAIL